MNPFPLVLLTGSVLFIVLGGFWYAWSTSPERTVHPVRPFPPPPPRPLFGLASFYGDAYRGKLMANGERYDPGALTAAGWDWPIGTVVRVTDNLTGRFVEVPIADRGPAKHLRARDRVIDLSRAAFERLAPRYRGLIEVRVDVVQEVRS